MYFYTGIAVVCLVLIPMHFYAGMAALCSFICTFCIRIAALCSFLCIFTQVWQPCAHSYAFLHGHSSLVLIYMHRRCICCTGLWESLRVSGSSLGASGSSLGASGSSLGALWEPLGASQYAKIYATINPSTRDYKRGSDYKRRRDYKRGKDYTRG